ncbi:hypothetical protein B0T10DRAFT_585004 [Thelonectria olida]|uniref:Uncharacterized protein n=1 Tax=Thelonectria olida TaxID=1576542 RepID=A0A9P8VSN3_9HYPO|nr:hypothetical protein B0T10DRAFT_593179 [Thelonectria olida]KAH6876695.1 hypothetical protein B0T10DRAFT_585004 [Thelonectria olida]
MATPSLSTGQPVDSHANGSRLRTAHSKPIRRVEPRYLPPKKPSADPRPSSKDSACTEKLSIALETISIWFCIPEYKDLEIGQPSIEEDNLLNMVTPSQENIQAERSKCIIARFRDSCLAAARQCAVSGMCSDTWRGYTTRHTNQAGQIIKSKCVRVTFSVTKPGQPGWSKYFR